MNLIYCEAHYSQTKSVFQTLYNEESALARQYEKKIRQLQKLPV